MIPARALALLWLLALALPALADPWPAPADPFVTDLADVLPDAEETRLRSDLGRLRDETGVEMAVLTIRSRAEYDASPSIAAFATGVFNGWGVGRADRNDGILLVVAAADRELRLALGAGYDQGYDVLAGDILARAVLPDLRAGEAARGILAGSREVMERIARRHAARLPAETPAREGLPGWLPFAVIAGAMALFAFRRRIADAGAGLRRCPDCGRRGLDRSGGERDGVPVVRTACRHCGYRHEREDRPPRKVGPGRSGGGAGKDFGGGTSSGGGATGRW